MSNPFVAEIRPVGFNFAPVGWATCDGQILAISQNTALFSLLGTQYGGNGQRPSRSQICAAACRCIRTSTPAAVKIQLVLLEAWKQRRF